ncbi:MAG: AraC family transcriptional regulator [Breznakibacter sp.]
MGFAQHDADWNFTNVKSPFVRVYYVTHGQATVEMGSQTHLLLPGNLYLIPAFTVHSDHCAGDFSLYYLHAYESQTKGLSIFDRFQFPFGVPATALHKQLLQRLVDINPQRQLRRYDPLWYDNTYMLHESIAQTASQPFDILFETQGILRMLMAAFLRGAKPKLQWTDKRLVDSMLYIGSHLSEPLTVRELASVSCLSADHFIRLFKKEMGCTPMVYVLSKRIEKAQSMLILTNLSIKDIAFQLSFVSLPHFNRVFKKMVGQTPMNYRYSAK